VEKFGLRTKQWSGRSGARLTNARLLNSRKKTLNGEPLSAHDVEQPANLNGNASEAVPENARDQTASFERGSKKNSLTSNTSKALLSAPGLSDPAAALAVIVPGVCLIPPRTALCRQWISQTYSSLKAQPDARLFCVTLVCSE